MNIKRHIYCSVFFIIQQNVTLIYINYGLFSMTNQLSAVQV